MISTALLLRLKYTLEKSLNKRIYTIVYYDRKEKKWYSAPKAARTPTVVKKQYNIEKMNRFGWKKLTLCNHNIAIVV